ncbi:MAG: hypothetical protein QM775_14140 [Pirellulales bacterium]
MSRAIVFGAVVLPLSVGLLFAWVRRDDPADFVAFTSRETNFEIFEGLPHPLDQKLLAEELRKSPYQNIEGDLVYSAPIALVDDDRRKLVAILSKPITYEVYRSKGCGGFHADFAVRWNTGPQASWIVLCFGCNEVKIVKSGKVSEYDLSESAADELRDLFRPYRQSRPQGLYEHWRNRPRSD